MLLNDVMLSVVNAECRIKAAYAECIMLSVIMLNVVMLNVLTLNVVMLSVTYAECPIKRCLC